MSLKFYTYVQNNSWGIFERPAGIVAVEAKDAKSANLRAKELGLYFKGQDIGKDCHCCGGDRWKVQQEVHGKDDIIIYISNNNIIQPLNLEDYFDTLDYHYRSKRCKAFKIPTVLIYYDDKRKSEYA